MVKAKREKKMTLAEYRREKLKQLLPSARAKIAIEQEKERQKMEGAKALRELEKEKEKIGSEKQKRVATITDLRDLYPGLSDSDFKRFVRSQYGFDIPAESQAMAKESEDKGFTQSFLSSLNKIKKVETLKKKIEKENLTGRKRLQVLDAINTLELRQRTQGEEPKQQPKQQQKQRMEEEKLVNEAKEAERKAAADAEALAKAQGKKTLVISKKKKPKQAEQAEVKLEDEAATALREKLVEQEAQQAQEELLNMPIAAAEEDAPELSQEEGLGLIKRYAIHPSRFTKDKGGLLNLNKKGVKHLKNVAKILHPQHLKKVVEFSVLNKMRNDIVAKNMKKEKNAKGGGFFGSILDGIF